MSKSSKWKNERNNGTYKSKNIGYMRVKDIQSTIWKTEVSERENVLFNGDEKILK